MAAGTARSRSTTSAASRSAASIIGFSAGASPGDVAWGDLGCDIVLECTGKFLKPEQLNGYFQRGVKRVIVAAPVKDDRALNVVVGVNDHLYEPERHRLLTAASCTTNCLAPVVKVVHEAIGIRHGQITTIHDPTNTNVVVDAPHKDLRRARSAMLSLQPTTTGSATAIALIYPELKGKLNGHAVRAPVLNASLTDCVFELKRPTTEAEVNELFATPRRGPLAGILGYETRPLVSADYCNDTRSSIVDAPSTMVTDGTLLKVYAWYDNEMGYVCRMVDLANMVIDAERVMARGDAQLPGRHGLLLGLHPDRRRAAHAGAAALLQARLLAVHAGLPVPALRVRRHRRQPRRRLAGDALRHPAHAGRGQALQIAGLVHAVGARSGLDRGRLGRLGGGRPGHRRARQGLHQDRVEDRRSRRRRPTARASSSNGWPGSPARRTP